MKIIDIHEAESTLSDLLAAIEKSGEVVLICRNGTPIAELRGVQPGTNPLAPHPQLSRVVFLQDPMAPLDSQDWPER